VFARPAVLFVVASATRLVAGASVAVLVMVLLCRRAVAVATPVIVPATLATVPDTG
jgi:hypothetical protein